MAGPIPSDIPKDLDEIVIEGPRHGPAVLVAEDLDRLPVVTVPRKTLLRVKPIEGLAATVSLYRLPDDELRQPSLRFEDVTAPLYVPAGRWIVSVSSDGLAPDLSLLDASAGAVAEIVKSRRKGWSLVVQVRGDATSAANGTATLYDAERFDAADTTASVLARTPLAGGTALFCGIGAAMGRVEVRADGYVPARLGAVSASPGTFTVRTTELQRGGTLALRFTLDGTPTSKVVWRIYEPAVRPERNLRLKQVAEGRPGPDGTARQGALAAGRYILRVLADKDSKTDFDDSVTITSGETLELSVDLVPITVDGTVTRGDTSVAGIKVRMSRVFSGESPDDDADTVVETDENGRYVATLWTEGTYDFLAMSAGGVPAAMKRLWIPRAGKRVDFELRQGAVRGTVLDGAEGAVVDATVALKDAGGFQRLARTDADGRFEFLLSLSGKVTVIADKQGYQRSDPLDLVVPDTGDATPVRVILRKFNAIRGHVFFASGPPAPNVSVVSVDGASGTSQDRATTQPDGSFEVRAPAGPGRLFISGPGCPLGSREVPPPPAETGPPVDVVLACAPQPSALSVLLRDESGQTVKGEVLRIRLNGFVVPDDVLFRHEQRLGLSVFSDSAGRVDLVAIEAGRLDVYLARSSSALSISAGLPNGFLLTEALQPGATVETLVTLRPITSRPSP